MQLEEKTHNPVAVEQKWCSYRFHLESKTSQQLSVQHSMQSSNGGDNPTFQLGRQHTTGISRGCMGVSGAEFWSAKHMGECRILVLHEKETSRTLWRRMQQVWSRLGLGEKKAQQLRRKMAATLTAFTVQQAPRLTEKLEDGGTKVILKEQYSGLTTFSPRLNDGDPKSECENNSPRVPLQLEHHGGVDGEHDYPTTAPRLKHHD
ncbi:hypothetical protein VIGAN_06016800 [Vigna angularis var. angularis]|uniref:Uncharacterized protein n=1 Tax=Vigna angularis var. angularis TaxID=157739 RepID=A0A0S3S8W7_PHAAN|nr:hypothetical protein VIGAN_06016800 [Vigna angularis var. angularis]